MIELKDIQGNKLLSVPITQSCQKVEELMVADYIQLSWDSNLSDEIPLGAYIEYNGERYSLLEPYNPTQKNESDYTYTPKFESRVRAWGKKPFFFYSGKSKEPDWTLTSNPSDFMRCVCDAIREETGESWTYSIDASLAASASLSFSSSDILSGLNQIADAFETEWLADKETNTIYLGLLSHGEEVTLEVGNNIGVPSIQNSKEGYYTRFYAFGSTRNITQDYTGSNTNNLVNKRLTLDPNKYPQGYKDIKSGLSEGEIFSKVLIFDNVYPSSKLSISGVRNRLMYRLDDSGDKIQLGTDENGNPIYDQYTIWYFRLEGFTFDWNNVIEGLTPSISFQSGALNGREFKIIYYSEDKKITSSDGIVFEAKQGDYEIEFIEENNLIIPTMTGLVPSDGDEVKLFNIKMHSEYTQSAYTELEEELDKAIARMTSDLNNYSFKSNPVAFNESNPNLSIGKKVRYVNGNYSYSTRVIKLTTQLDYPIEQDITIGNEKVKGNTQQLREEVASANKDLNLMSVFNNMTQSLQQSYNRTQQMMLEGFAAIKNIWQIRETENGEKYVFSAYDVATQKGITMYHDGKMLNLPSLASGLPFDGRTIWYNPDTNQIEVIGGTGGGSGEGGVSNFWDLSGIPSWITNSKPKYTYSEIEGTPDLTKYALVSQIPSLSGYATESWVTKQNYATKATTLSGYGITDAYTKTNVDDLLKSYVTLSGSQTITGEKNFTGGLKVNGSPIYYDTEKKYWKLEGDLLVTGGVTMYGSDSSFTPSTIMDAILYDTATLGINSNGQLYVKGGAGGGINTTDLQNYLTSNSYLNVTSGDNRYLKLSGGTITGTLIVNENLGVGGSIVNKNHYLFVRDNANADWIVTNQGWKAEYTLIHSGNIGSYNVDSANRLHTPRTIWGQSFDGSGNVSGVLSLGNSYITSSTGVNILDAQANWVILGSDTNAKGWTTYINGYNINFRCGTGGTSAMYINNELNIGVGKQSPNYKLDVNGTFGADTIYQNGVTLANTYLSLGGGSINAGATTTPLVLNTTDSYNRSLIIFRGNSNNQGQVGYAGSGYGVWLYNFNGSSYIGVKDDGTPHYNQNPILHSGNYSNYALPLSGGTLTSSSVPLYIDRTDPNSYALIGYMLESKAFGYLGFSNYGDLVVSPNRQNGNTNYYTVWHSGNDSSGSGLDADKLDGVEYQNILERDCSGASRCSSVGWHRIAEFKAVSSNVILMIHRVYNNHSPESYVFSISRIYNQDKYCITQLSGTYSTQLISSIRIDVSWNHNGYIDFYYNSTSGNSVCWTVIGGATAYTSATFNPTTIGVQHSITPMQGLQTTGDILSHGGMTMYSMRSMKNIVDEKGLSLSELSAIKPTRYTWKDGRDNRLHFGGIADDIQQVLPEVVYMTSDGILTMDYGNAAFAVASSLINPVVDHEKRIEMLEEENKRLRLEVERLKSA